MNTEDPKCTEIIEIKWSPSDNQPNLAEVLAEYLIRSAMDNKPVCLHITKVDNGHKTAKTDKSRKRAPFSSCIMDYYRRDEILALLHSVIDGKGAKELGHIIHTLINSGVILRPTFPQLKDEFQITHTRSAYEKYMKEYIIIPEDISNHIREVFKDFIIKSNKRYNEIR